MKTEKNKSLKREVKALKNMLEALKLRGNAIELENEALNIKVDALSREREAYKQKYELENSGYKPLKKDYNNLKSEYNSLLDKYKLLKTEQITLKPKSKNKITVDTSEDINVDLMNIITKEIKNKINQSFPSNDIPKRLTKELGLLAENGFFTTIEIREKYSISRPTAQRDIKCLRECGWIKLKAGKSKGIFILTEEGEGFVKNYYSRYQ
ncbi:MAG: HTH domain-containing protein [Ignavibacteria bacterium]|nr:HTH domain-containing protein [Bacteroidota bacterium]MBL7128373.1 HTH domain-containing protein [Ignavibacteria bacterium]